MFLLKNINNLLLDELINIYAKENKKEFKETIFEEMMSNGWFIIPVLNVNLDTNTYDVEWIKDYQDKVYLPVFTSFYNFMEYKRLKANKVIVCNFKLALKMYESIEKQVYNIVINPTTNELNLGKIDIATIRSKYNTSIYRQDLNSMEIIDLPKNKVCAKNKSNKINEINMPLLFKKELLTIAKFHKSIDKVYLMGSFNKKDCVNEYDIIIKQDKKENCGELYINEIEKVLSEYVNKTTTKINIQEYNEIKEKNKLKQLKPFYEKE